MLYRNNTGLIPLTIARSRSSSDFHRMVQNYPRNASHLSSLVPHLSSEMSLCSSDDQEEPVNVLHPLIALQVTIFPNSGISISMTYRQVAGDGRTMTNFVKSWASIFKSINDGPSVIVVQQPFHDRENLINAASNGLLSLLCRLCHELGGVSWDCGTTLTTPVKLEDIFHATFVFRSQEINPLRSWITSRFRNLDEAPPLPNVSAYVIACAFTWICLLKTENIAYDNDSAAHFGFFSGCSGKQELKVPETYIGNCLRMVGVSLMKSELMGENGLQVAAKAIMQGIKNLETGFLEKARTWLPDAVQMMSSDSVTIVAGSPKLRDYETDFGWGTPKKSEAVHINKAVGLIALTESRDEKGGIEVGISLNKIEMEAFASIFGQGLKKYMS